MELYFMKINNPWALFATTICVAAIASFAQIVECKFDYCEVRDDHWGGTTAKCYYKVCDDDIPRTSDSKHKPYSCRGSKHLFAKKPECKQVLAEERQAAERARRQEEYEQQKYNEYVNQQLKEQAKYERQQKMHEDSATAKRMANWLINQIPNYIEKVNTYLVNGTDPILANLNLTMNEFDPNETRYNLYQWNDSKADPIAIKQPSKGFGIEFQLKENLNKSSCQKGMSVVLKMTLKKGLHYNIVDGCDFWDSCEKKEGLVIDKTTWIVSGKSL